MSTVEMKVSELSGAALDWAVAHATEAWRSAHAMFPTMTLDSTFSGVKAVNYSSGRTECLLVPNNPMRQDFQTYAPSTDWSQGGPLMERHCLSLLPQIGGAYYAQWAVPNTNDYEERELVAPNALLAICRAVVSKELGDFVQIPAELAGVQP